MPFVWCDPVTKNSLFRTVEGADRTICTFLRFCPLQVDDKAAGQKDKPAATASDTVPQSSSAAATAAATPGPTTMGAATPKAASTLSRQGSGRAGGTPKGKDTPRTSGKTAAKSSKKVVPASFVEVIDCLVDVCLQYKGVQPEEAADLADPVASMDTEPFFEVGNPL